MNPHNPALPCKHAQQEKFAQLLAAGGRVKESYTQAGYADGQHVAQNANKLRKKLRPRIVFLEKQRADDDAKAREAAIKASGVDRGWVMQRSREIVERCMEPIAVLDRHGKPTGVFRYQAAAAIRALELMGKELGMYQTKREDSFLLDRQRLEAMTPDERIESNRQLLEEAKRRLREYRAQQLEQARNREGAVIDGEAENGIGGPQPPKAKPFRDRANGKQPSACAGSDEPQNPASQDGPRAPEVRTYIGQKRK